MALDQLAGSNAQNNPNMLGNFISHSQPLPPQLGLGNLRDRLIERRNHIGNGFYNNSPPLMSIDGPPSHFQPSPMPDYGMAIGFRPQPPMLQPAMPDYSSQFEKFGEQLTGFGDQMTGYQDALGSFNEQVGGMGKQFETITNRLDSVDKGLGSLGNQIAGLEQAQSQQQEVAQPQRPAFNPFNPFGFGGLGSLFMRR